MGFESEYAEVTYIEEDGIVLLCWKKEARLENYREPTLFALELLRKHEGSNFVVDARNGFEDDKHDVNWGFTVLLPAMAKTTCRFVCFIMNKINDIAEEMDMWTVEFGKYFAVTRAADYNHAILTMKKCIYANVRYEITEGKREEFLKQLEKIGMAENSRREPGNISYEVLLPIESQNAVCLNEMWINEHEQKKHGKTEHYRLLSELKEKYVESVHIVCYQAEKIK